QLPASPELRVAKAQLRRINEITKEQLALFAELTELINAHNPQLLEQRSVGTVTAAVIIGRTAGAQRFRSEACFARHAGTAPIPATSGNTVRYRLHRGGDRQLNRAIHIIALGRVAWDPATRAYIQRKQAEGKTKLEAIRCLKRHIARQIWHLLYNTQPATTPPPLTPPPSIKATAPALMRCIR
ncbi:MAG TPA: transposase, partial [Solirubrobacteraceae bacterium]|nr:transposase [Solirubrobacteraceae bacterium]